MSSLLYKNRLPIINEGNKWYIFSPYKARLVVINEPNSDILNQQIKNYEPVLMGEPRGPYKNSKVKRFVFVATSACNLHCDYCYSVGQQPPIWMDKEAPVDILRKTLTSDTETVFVSFFGGEPTLNMEAITNTVNYLKKLGIRTYLRINTNGLVKKSTFNYLIDNGFKIIISSDGLPKVSSLHRKRDKKTEDIGVSKKVEDSIKHLVFKNADFRVRCTITKDNLHTLEESIQYWKSLGVEYVHLEPINPQSHDKHLMDLLPSAEEFVDYFKKALSIAERLGVWITTGIYMNLLTPSDYFCTTSTGEYLVYNPDNSISACYRVQNKNHEQRIYCFRRFE